MVVEGEDRKECGGLQTARDGRESERERNRPVGEKEGEVVEEGEQTARGICTLPRTRMERNGLHLKPVQRKPGQVRSQQ
jgi:hypothetical protein